mmetsp:Transcript_136638/g.237577  ORF Transcript_136638/g.237577 Transcript_136638/m.237577 type:complete len:533 (-) Transcript_136638:40-1638(-)
MFSLWKNALCSISMSYCNAISKLSATSRKLLCFKDGGLDLKSEDGIRACKAFLAQVQVVERSLQIAPHCREYQAALPKKYQKLLSQKSSLYRVEVLEACLSGRDRMRINHREYLFSVAVQEASCSLTVALQFLFFFLDKWQACRFTPGRAVRCEVERLLLAFDSAWVEFECSYINNLVQIEEEAKSVFMQAYASEQRLQEFCSCQQMCNTLQYVWLQREELQVFIECIDQLNDAANFQWKRVSCLKIGVFDAASRVLFGCDCLDCVSLHRESGKACAAKCLAADILDAFKCMREYFRQVEEHLDDVSPHLSQNEGLVSCLSRLVRSCSVGAEYLQCPPALRELCSLVDDLHALQQTLAPGLATLCEECAVEWFLVLPHLVWLCMLATPGHYAGLVTKLMPRRGNQPSVSAGLLNFALFKKFHLLQSKLLQDDDSSSHCAPSLEDVLREEREHMVKTWTVIVQRVVNSKIPQGQQSTSIPKFHDSAERTYEEFIRELECRSMDLQRSRPEDWNNFSAVLTKCLTADQWMCLSI